MKRKIIMFMPSIEGGGVEKNFFLVCNYLVKKVDTLKVITVSKKYKKRGPPWGPKWVARIPEIEIAGLRHFLPSLPFFKKFLNRF